MRSFEERKAEIFHRSYKRIEKKKRIRNRIVLTCIPIFFCLVFASITLFSRTFSAYMPIHEEMTNSSETFSSYIGAKVILLTPENKYNKTFDDKDKVADIKDTIHSITESFYSSFAEDSSKGQELKSQILRSDEYKIILKNPDGRQEVYKLKDTLLTSVSTSAVYHLSDTQAIQIYSVLGLHNEN